MIHREREMRKEEEEDGEKNHTKKKRRKRVETRWKRTKRNR